MKYYLFCALLLMISACTSTQEGEIDHERALRVHEKFRHDMYDFMTDEDNDFEMISYIFSDRKPVVSLKNSGQLEGYLLLYLPSFGDYTLITVFPKNNGGTLNVRAIYYDSPYLDKLNRNETFRLTKEQMDLLRNVVEENPFWEGDVPDRRGVRDGFSFYVEVKQNGHFYKDLKHTPKAGRAYNIALYMMELSGTSF